MPSLTFPAPVESYLAGYSSAATVAAYRRQDGLLLLTRTGSRMTLGSRDAASHPCSCCVPQIHLFPDEQAELILQTLDQVSDELEDGAGASITPGANPRPHTADLRALLSTAVT